MPNVVGNQDGAEKGIRQAQPPELRAFQQPTTASHQQESFEPVEIDLGLIDRYPLLAERGLANILTSNFASPSSWRLGIL